MKCHSSVRRIIIPASCGAVVTVAATVGTLDGGGMGEGTGEGTVEATLILICCGCVCCCILLVFDIGEVFFLACLFFSCSHEILKREQLMRVNPLLL